MGRSGRKKVLSQLARTTVTRSNRDQAKFDLGLPQPDPETKISAKNKNEFFKQMYAQTKGLDAHCDLKKDTLLDQQSAYNFAERLRFYHEITADSVDKTAFERILAGSCQDTGKDVSKPDSKTYPGADITIDNKRASLKTEGSKNMKLNEIHISKLMEAAWSKKIRSKRDAFEGMEKVKEHLGRYENIYVLRSFNDQPVVYYQLYEIPQQMVFDAIDRIKTRDFKDITPSGGTRATAKGEDGKPLFDLIIDGSDNKIILTKIDTDNCDLHAEWWIEARPDFFD